MVETHCFKITIAVDYVADTMPEDMRDQLIKKFGFKTRCGDLLLDENDVAEVASFDFEVEQVT